MTGQGHVGLVEDTSRGGYTRDKDWKFHPVEFVCCISRSQPLHHSSHQPLCRPDSSKSSSFLIYFVKCYITLILILRHILVGLGIFYKSLLADYVVFDFVFAHIPFLGSNLKKRGENTICVSISHFQFFQDEKIGTVRINAFFYDISCSGVK